MMNRETRKRFSHLVYNSFAFRMLVGFLVCFPVVFLIAIVGQTTKAYFTPTDDYFSYAAKSCTRPDGTQQIRAIEYIRVVKQTSTSEIGIEFASCSVFHKALPATFHDRLFCSVDGKYFTLVSHQEEKVERSRTSVSYVRKPWVYTSDFYLDKKCYLDSEVTIRDGVVKKPQSIISEVFVPSMVK